MNRPIEFDDEDFGNTADQYNYQNPINQYIDNSDGSGAGAAAASSITVGGVSGSNGNNA